MEEGKGEGGEGEGRGVMDLPLKYGHLSLSVTFVSQETE